MEEEKKFNLYTAAGYQGCFPVTELRELITEKQVPRDAKCGEVKQSFWGSRQLPLVSITSLAEFADLAASLTDPTSQNVAESNRSIGGKRSVMSRYTDAYLVARSITTVGTAVKAVGVIIGLGIALIGVVANFTTDSQSVKYAIAGVVLGVIVTIPIYIMGILIAAQGQILKATLDTAVNTSPLLTKDEMRQIMR
jgi:hypothetical protein